MDTTHYIAFSGLEPISQGPLTALLPALKTRFDRDPGELNLVFELPSGRQVDFDLRGSLDAILAREVPTASRGPGRPKLGVRSREISLLPRHWDWLESRPQGISATVRRLVERAMKDEPAADRLRRERDALVRILGAVAGDLPGFEEASRALYAGDRATFQASIAAWPVGLRSFASAHGPATQPATKAV